MGDARLSDVLRQRLLVLEGDRELARRFERLFEFEGSGFTGGHDEPHATHRERVPSLS